jgi:outer membrane immunogenic protein
MKMKKQLAAAVMLATLTATPAFAQDNAFSGFKLGGEIALKKNKADITAPGNINLSDSDRGTSLRGFAGYDVQLSDQFIVGTELGISTAGSTVKASQGPASFSIDPKLTLDASVRAGFTVTDNILLYARAGYASSKLDFRSANTDLSSDSISRNKRSGGLLLGAGTEVALGDNFGLRAEYRRTKINDLKSNQATLGAYVRF